MVQWAARSALRRSLNQRFRRILEDKQRLAGTFVVDLSTKAEPRMAVMEIDELVDLISESTAFQDHSGYRQLMEVMILISGALSDFFKAIIAFDGLIDHIVEFEAGAIDSVKVKFPTDQLVEIKAI